MFQLTSIQSINLFTLIMIALLLLMIVENSYAARAEYSIGVQGRHTDNANLTHADEINETRVSALAGLSVVERGSELAVDVNAMLEVNDYLDDVFEDDTWAYLNGNINWTIYPTFMYWNIEDYFSQVRIDPFLTDLPDNLVNTNVFSTGPDLHFRINSSNQIQLNARYSDYTYDDINTDSIRNEISAGWVNELSRSIRMSFNVNYQSTRFDELTNSNYNRYDYFYNMYYEYGRSTIEYDLGLSYIKQKLNDDIDGYLWRILWRNQFRSESYFTLDMHQQYTDVIQDLLDRSNIDQVLDLVSEQLTGDIFYDTRLTATYHFGSSTNSYEIQAFIRDEDYENEPLDRVIRSILFNYYYRISSTVDTSSTLAYQRSKYLDTDEQNEQYHAIISMGYRLSRNYTVNLEYNYNQQDSNVAELEYAENSILLTLFYGRDPRTYR